MDSANWKRRIVEMVFVKHAIYTLDREGIYEYHLPELAATEAELVAVEEHLEEPLPPHYRAFLKHVNGWRAFWQSAYLFGTRELVGGSLFQHAMSLLGYLEEEDVLRNAGIRRQDLLAIAVKPRDIDLFVIGRQAPPIPGVVLWFAGNEVQRFPDFGEYFLAMMDYNRLMVQRLQLEAEQH